MRLNPHPIAVDSKNPIVKSGKKLKGTFPLGLPFNENPLLAGVFVKIDDYKYCLPISGEGALEKIIKKVHK